MLPTDVGLPVITNPVTVRASAVLEAAGAWDTTPLEIASAGFRWATFYVSYTRGGAGGAVDFQLELSPYSADLAGVEDWFNQTAFQSGAVAAGADTQSFLQQEYDTYTSQGAAIENFVYGPIQIDAIERFRMLCRESGAAGTPGTVHVVAVLWK